MIQSFGQPKLFLTFTLLSLFAWNSLANQVGKDESNRKLSSTKIKVCYEESDFIPFQYIDSVTQDRKGVLLDILNSAAIQQNLSIHYYRRPWKRCISEVANGLADGLFAAIWLSEREEWGKYPKLASNPKKVDPHYRLWTAEYKIFTHIDSQLSWDGKRFNNLKFGLSAPLGYVAEKKLRSLNALGEFNHDPTQGLVLASKARIDGYVVEENIGLALLNSLDIQQDIKLLNTNFIEADWYFVFSHQYFKAHPSKAKQFWNGIRSAREKNGQGFVNKYARSVPDD